MESSVADPCPRVPLLAPRNFTASDTLRDELAAIGVEVRETPELQVTTVTR